MNNIQSPILVTGGAGFIGANLTHFLNRRYKNIHLIIRKKTNIWRLKPLLKQINLHEIDLGDKKNLQSVINQIYPKVIFHLASYGNYHFQKDFSKIIKTNIIGTVNLLEACSQVNFDCFINIGSSSEYGIKNKAMNESNILEPASFYAASKCAATLISQVFSEQHDKPIITIRPFSVYGPYEDKRRFIPTVMHQILQKKPIKLTPKITRRDFIHINDVINALIKVSQNAKYLKGKILNVGTGKQYSNEDIVNILFKITKTKIKVEKGAYSSHQWDTNNWIADISKIKLLCGWEPKNSIEQGLTKTWNWFIEYHSLYEKESHK